jgi:hypothetical protein
MKTKTKAPTDFNINDGGSIVSITPLTAQAREWMTDNVHTESWQWMGPTLAVDHRMAQDLIDGINDAGFSVE